MIKSIVLFVSVQIFVLSSNGQTTNFIDRESKVAGFFEKGWYIKNIPFVEIPDQNIEDVYYYRWSSHKRHLRYTALGLGYTVTEFVSDVSWQNKLAVINDAGGHHIYESRWIRDPDQRYVKDYINFYARGFGKSGTHQYSEWIADAAYNAFLVNGDKEFITSQLDGFVNIYDEWIDWFEPRLGLYFIVPLYDAQEYSCASVQTNDPFGGGLGYRPSHNSEMYANAQAIAKIANLKDATDIEQSFTERAKALRESILTHLWDSQRNFFYHMQREDNPNDQLLDSREEVGFYPWRFGVPDDRFNYSVAFDVLFDPAEFDSKYGPTTCEMTSPWFDGDQTNQCCWWNGNSWPYSTSHVLTSLAAHIRQYSHQNPRITVDNYVSALKKYALTQYKDNKPYVAECHSPGGDFWVCDSRNHSEHYAHSTYVDNVLTDLLGIIPQEDNTLVIYPLIPTSWDYFALEDVLYHGHNVTVVFDRNGNKYQVEKGLTVFVDGSKVAHTDELQRLVVEIPEVSTVRNSKRLENYAVNPLRAGYPRPYASFTDKYNAVTYQAVDGRIFYDYIPSNRWTNFESAQETDWFAIDFGREKTFDSVNVYVYSDVVTHEGVCDCPTKMVVQYFREDQWFDAENQKSEPSQCSPNDLNRITFDPVKTSQLRVVFTRNVAQNYYVGITEIEVWAEFPQSESENSYEAEDGIINNALMLTSSSASGQSYVGRIDYGDSWIEINRVYVEKWGDYKIRVFYTNAEASNGVQNLLVNNMNTLLVTYPPTNSGWGQFYENNYVEVTIPLLSGNNVLQFSHNDGFAELDRIEVIV